MIKGGFQGLDISDVDFTAASPTIPGGYAACAAADGKTMRVLTADGVVQCSVKKVSTSYVLGGVTGDGEILSITISSSDGITVSKAKVFAPQSSSGKWVVADAVNLSTYDGSSDEKKYVTPADGYVHITAEAEATGYEVVRVHKGMGSATTALRIIRVNGGTMKNENAVFVKAGSVISHESGTNTGTWFVRYYALQ